MILKIHCFILSMLIIHSESANFVGCRLSVTEVLSCITFDLSCLWQVTWQLSGMASCSGAEIYSWFQQSSAAARIDTIVNLVTMLHPAELRFLSTWVEFQSRKDTDTLRPFETRGNDPTYLCQLTDPSDSTIRNSLIFSMSLMHLANDKAATIVYS